ncbi:response regulator transcription factor [Paraglaciecola marina]|uniref:response regulator transcription factor n=1 Tax=Paraglaciecola marina TaxID=2500157 RepID=UPI00105DB8A7|nr:helix-turn-helix transcriptional regulator [Paraglaciecola marina]
MQSSHNDFLSTETQTELINALGTNHFFNVLVDALSAVICFGSSSAICYNKHKAPELLFSNLTELEDKIFYARFLDGAYVASPAYQGFMNDLEGGLYAWSELMPEGFKQSQMYAAYYQESGIEDLAYFFVNCGDLGFIQFSIGRHCPSSVFTEAELLSLQTVSSVLIALVTKHWQFAEQQQGKNVVPLSSMVSERVNYLLNHFEPELLTARERQIAKLVITGHSSQSAADNLHISPGTERVHRAKLYAKLKLRSNSELFSYFLNQLRCVD